MIRDEKTKQFKPVPVDQKTPKMIEMEKKLGVIFEDNYKKDYIDNPNRSQRNFAIKWETYRRTIWHGNSQNVSRSRTPSWVERVGLKDAPTIDSSQRKTDACEICGKNEVNPEKAHWIPNKDGGSMQSYNILKLCPTCHTKLDNNRNPELIEKCRRILFARVMQKMTKKELNSYEDKIRLLNIAKQIINRKIEK